VSVLADRLVPVVLAFAALNISASVSDPGVAIGAQLLRVVVLALAGGAIDRILRRADRRHAPGVLLLPDGHAVIWSSKPHRSGT
jgi:hypothetical protein